MQLDETYDKELIPEMRDAADFPWEEIFARDERNEPKPEPDEEQPKFTAQDVFQWIFEPLDGRGSADLKLRTVGRRFVALCWVSNPQYFGKEPSMNTVAKSIGCHKAVLSELTAEATRRFGRRNRNQHHAGNFKPNADQ